MLPKRALLLVRISDDKAGDAAGVGRQEEDGRDRAKKLGWGIAEVVVENDTSAFKRRHIRLPDGSTGLRTVRPGFRYCIEKLNSGERDGLIAYDLDRVARDPRDLEDLIDTVESRTPRLAVASVTGSLRLDTDADVTMARVMVAVANKSSRDTSRRVSRKHEQLAAEGKPGGGGFRGYGFDRTGLAHIEEEAAIVREVAARILGTWDGWTAEQRAEIVPELGESLNSIAADLRERGVPTVTGAPWNSRSVKSIVTKPSVAGLRARGKEIVADAVWPAILDRAVWERVGARLAGRGRNVDLSLVRWLTGVLMCSHCGRPLCGWQGSRGRGPKYWCATPRGGCGRTTINAANAEDEVERQVLELLTMPRILERLRHAADNEASDDARQELALDEEQLKELARGYARREITFLEYREARSIIDSRVKESRALLTSRAPLVLRRLLAGDVLAGWEALAPADKREVARALVPDGYRVMPHDRSKGNKFDPGRIVLIER